MSTKSSTNVLGVGSLTWYVHSKSNLRSRKAGLTKTTNFSCAVRDQNQRLRRRLTGTLHLAGMLTRASRATRFGVFISFRESHIHSQIVVRTCIRSVASRKLFPCAPNKNIPENAAIYFKDKYPNNKNKYWSEKVIKLIRKK